MRVLLLRSLGGHPTRTVVDQDQAAAEWLLSVGFAVPADDEPDPADDETEDETEVPDEPVTSTSTRRVRRSPRTATPGG